MPLVKRLRKRGANMTVVAYGEVEFGPTGDVSEWMRRFSRSIRRYTASAAPSNKRPHWGYMGTPLKRSFRASTSAIAGQTHVDAAVGSTKHYAGFVNDGTQDHSAVLLPPWKGGGFPLLWEASWPPGKASRTPMRVRGQKAQGFLQEGLHRAFVAEGMPSVVVPFTPGEMATFPDRLADEVTKGLDEAWQTGFAAQLALWRAERDAAWSEHAKVYAPRTALRASRARFGRRASSDDRRKAQSAARSRKYRQSAKYRNLQDKRREEAKKIKKPKRGYESVRDKNAAALDKFIQAYPNIIVKKRNDRGVFISNGRQDTFVPWSSLYKYL
jgi:hypothetical protein